jgi:hypothetical protein
VVRGLELIDGHLVAYSLGNFMTYGGISVSGVLGYAPLLLVRLDAHGQLVSGRIVSFRQRPLAALAVDPHMGAGRTIHAMTMADFDGGGLVFTPDFGFAPQRSRILEPWPDSQTTKAKP